MTIDPRNVRPALILYGPSDDERLREASFSPQNEVVALRREHSKTFDLGFGQYLARNSVGPVHYKEDPDDDKEAWKEIDLSIGISDKMEAACYKIDVLRSGGVGYTYVSRRGGRIDVELLEVGGKNPTWGSVVPRSQANQFFWDDVGKGLDMKLLLRPRSAEIFQQLDGPTSPRTLKWRVREDVSSEAEFRRSTAGADANGDQLEILTNVGPETIVTVGDRTYREFEYTETWTGRVSRVIAAGSRQKAWFDDPVYPVIIDAATQELIQAGVDDGYGNNATSWVSSYAGDWLWGLFTPYNVDADGGTRFRTLGRTR